MRSPGFSVRGMERAMVCCGPGAPASLPARLAFSELAGRDAGAPSGSVVAGSLPNANCATHLGQSPSKASPMIAAPHFGHVCLAGMLGHSTKPSIFYLLQKKFGGAITKKYSSRSGKAGEDRGQRSGVRSK